MDISSPFGDGMTPATRAVATGHPEIARHLVAHGAPDPDLRPGQRLVAAALVADHATVSELRAARPGLVDAVRQARPSLAVWAAAHGRPGSVELLQPLTAPDDPAAASRLSDPPGGQAPDQPE